MTDPSRQPAVLLRDLRGLTSYVECRGNLVAGEARRFTLHAVREGEDERWLLVGDDPPADGTLPGEVGTVEPHDEALIFRRGLVRGRRNLTVISTREAGTLLELLPLEAAPAPPGLTQVLFATRDAAQAQELVAACVSLGQDRIWLARAGAGGAEQLLLRGDHAPSYVVLRNAQLAEICRRVPRSLAELRAIAGIGEASCRKYGEELLALIPADLLPAPSSPATAAGNGPSAPATAAPEGGDA
jgi:hypothetical protein